MGCDDLRYIESSDVNNSNRDLLKSICFDRNLVLVNNLIFNDKVFLVHLLSVERNSGYPN